MPNKMKHALGFDPTNHGLVTEEWRTKLEEYVTYKLIANGLPFPSVLDEKDDGLGVEAIMTSVNQRLQRLDDVVAPIDQRIEQFLEKHFADVSPRKPMRLPRRSVNLDRHGLARTMSLPFGGDEYSNASVSSYRVRNGVLHNPLHDRRTTKGTFHVTVGGLPVPRDKKAVPKRTFVELFYRAFDPPTDVLELPFSETCDEPARTFVSLLLRPLVCPEVPGVCEQKSMEIRFFAPGSLVSNLDFVESIFGNAGDPFAPENDAALDVKHWTGTTGCVILAPHLGTLTKKEVGLPHYDDATPRQREDGMCWKDDKEFYNEGTPFKLTCRTEEGVIITLISDNYFGYCKKEVKTQIGYTANLFGNVEEEHSGGAIAFASFNLGEEFEANSRLYNNRTFDDVARDYGDDFVDVQPEGYGIDRNFRELIYIPENARASIRGQKISWESKGQEQSIPLHPNNVYMTPSGYKIRLQKHPAAAVWRLIGTLAEGVNCHKPCTVSGGGKSEISKSVADYVLYGPIFVADLKADLDIVEQIFEKDYSSRWAPDGPVKPDYSKRACRKILDPSRTLGSVIKMLTPSTDFSQEYNTWLESIPDYIYALVFVIKQLYRPEEHQDWRQFFKVDIVNGTPGHELKIGNRKLIGSYLRVGLLDENTWRTYKLRQDFAPAQKLQTEDDITASVVIPQGQLNHLGQYVEEAESCKFSENCEFRLFQRPDDAIHRGLDKQSESDLARKDNFICNFEPLAREQIREICEKVVDLSQFTEPMQKLMLDVKDSSDSYAVCSATPRMVNGEPSRNPRYLQNRPDLIDPLNKYVARMGTRLFRAVPADQAVPIPVHSVLLGRRNNPPDYERGFRPLAVYNPIHYQELPELFMDFVSALTGKSPSTTGAGSEGALTKGPFNALLPITDLNNALVSFLLTGLAGFSTPAGHIGPNVRVDHDISLLIPEIWCRLSPEDRMPKTLIEEELLEKLEDFEHNGQLIPASRLGYRITSRFIRRYVGRVFDNPNKVFSDKILRPEKQDLDAFADGVLYISEAHERVAKLYFEDGSIDQACPPLRALLHIMAHGDYDGLKITDAKIRELFTVQSMLKSDWYQKRLQTKQERDRSLFQRHRKTLDEYAKRAEATALKDLDERRKYVEAELKRIDDSKYLESLAGYLGADPMGIE